MIYTDDPARDFDRWDAEQEQLREKLPVCDDCGKRINDDFYWEFDGEVLCENCVNRRYRKYTDSYIQNN